MKRRTRLGFPRVTWKGCGLGILNMKLLGNGGGSRESQREGRTINQAGIECRSRCPERGRGMMGHKLWMVSGQGNSLCTHEAHWSPVLALGAPGQLPEFSLA